MNWQKERLMKLLGWTIVASGLIVGIAACTVTTEDATSDGGTSTGGTAGAGGSTAGAGGSTAGAAGSTAGSAGTAGAAGSQSCEVTDPDAAGACAVCAAGSCCTAFLACDDNTVCKPILDCALTCWSDPDSGVAKFSDCIDQCASTAGYPQEMDLVNAYYACLCTDSCKTSCEAEQMCP